MGENLIMQYIEIKDNKIIGHYSARKKPEGERYKEVDNSFTGYIGQSADWFDWNNRGKRIPDEKLIQMGIRKDFRGKYYDKETREEKEITELDIEPEKQWTSRKPDFDNPFLKWNEDKKEWITDKTAKHIAEIKEQIAQKKMLSQKVIIELSKPMNWESNWTNCTRANQ